jgi:hypothetical protein
MREDGGIVEVECSQKFTRGHIRGGRWGHLGRTDDNDKPLPPSFPSASPCSDVGQQVHTFHILETQSVRGVFFFHFIRFQNFISPSGQSIDRFHAQEQRLPKEPTSNLLKIVDCLLLPPSFGNETVEPVSLK